MTDSSPTPPVRPGLMSRVLGWLRAGYPQGIPQSDYVALFAVLHRNLTDYEVVAIGEQLIAANPNRESISHAEIAAAVADFAKQQPAAEDVSRVASHLAAGGWPLAEPIDDSE
ncbi:MULTISPECIES: DUF3349 domain-containing protein [Nocardia]|uniref:DUF3349 domain-containing protein n=1 Tax=Nocardia coubleae TaxID=356147 RepID=A0A846W4J2_9NOCA|nr:MULTISPECIES: DUF3349 domain-containing protein [Nocardia]MCA2205632.1 DUF3349 domain-containing protein [Nocardia rosealba]NKX87773.1 DUF3349 domain-containing protein [Nocardia coubleae]